jgi:hypothetical protein
MSSMKKGLILGPNQVIGCKVARIDEVPFSGPGLQWLGSSTLVPAILSFHFKCSAVSYYNLCDIIQAKN